MVEWFQVVLVVEEEVLVAITNLRLFQSLISVVVASTGQFIPLVMETLYNYRPPQIANNQPDRNRTVMGAKVRNGRI